MAQLVEYVLCKHGVRGSSPLISKNLSINMVNIKFKDIKDFITYDFFWRCFKLTFYTCLLGAYFDLYFDKSNLYAPFYEGNLSLYKLVISAELILSFFYLFLVVGGLFKYKDLSIKHHKVWFWIFMVVLGLWFTTVWFKFSIVWILGNDNGLLYRSPLQNLVSAWSYGVKFHYEPGVYLVHQTWMIQPFDYPSIVDANGYVDNIKYYNILCDHKETLLKNYRSDDSIIPYVKALKKFNLSFKVINFFGEEKFLDKDFFYYWTL